MTKIKVLEGKVKQAINLIRTLKEENKRLKSDRMKLVSELELLRNDAKGTYKLRSELEQIIARDKKIKDKIFDLKHKVDRLNI
ncbi:MAG: hypothetical protein ABII27_03655 [bacterium]